MREARPHPAKQADLGPRIWRPTEWCWTIAVVTAALLPPAIYNRFPLIFPDTNAYIGAALGREWPLDRSGFYGLFAKPFLTSMPPVTGVWAVIVVQCLFVSAVMTLVARRLDPEASTTRLLALLVPIALLTTVPWHAAQVMPDAFTGPLILTIWLASTRDLAAPGTALLWFVVGVVTLLHYTHIGLMAAAAGTCLMICAIAGMTIREIAKRALAAALVMTAVLAAHITVNGMYFGRWSVSPMGGMFLFARVHEDGLVQPWFDRHCGRDAPKPLCDMRQQIPSDSQVLLWGYEKSPFDRLINSKAGEPETWPWIDMMSEAAIGSIKEQPTVFAGNIVKSAAEQFVTFRALDDECPDRCQSLFLDKGSPALIEDVRASRQLQDQISRGPIRTITDITSWLGLLALLPLLAVAFRRRDPMALSLLGTALIALIANAAMTGGLSDVHDRYQSRIIWLAPFIALMLLLRWRAARPSTGGVGVVRD